MSKSLFFLALLVVSQAFAREVIEDESWYDQRVATRANDAHYVLNLDAHRGLLDVRGTGDTAWSFGATPARGSSKPREATFAGLLSKVDPRRDLFVGDLSLTNLETAVGNHCDRIRQSVDFYFLTSPRAVEQAIQHGFNLLGMANNHSQDCDLGRASSTSTPKHGPLMTEEALQALRPGAAFAWAGVGQTQNQKISVRTFQVKGKAVRVALGALTIVGWDMPNTNAINVSRGDVDAQITAALAGFLTAKADIRILSIHTQDGSGHRKREQRAFLALKTAAQRFITRYNGDVVFGHGPHTYAGVRLIPKRGGGHGVIFTSLGNFIHDGLSSNADNYLARAVFDFKAMKLKQVQVLPYRNGKSPSPVSFYGYVNPRDPSARDLEEKINANFEWQLGGFRDAAGVRRRLYYADLF